MSAKKPRKAKVKRARAEKPRAKGPKKRVRAKEKVEEIREKETVERVEMAPVPAPISIPPRAVVNVRHAGSMMDRDARGYSWGELSEAKIERAAARRMHVPVDVRRRTKVKGNVERLEAWLRTATAGRPPSVRKTGSREKK